MNKITVLLSVVVFVSCKARQNFAKTLGSNATDGSSFASVKKLIAMNNKQEVGGCTATLLDETTVLTAAHCLVGQNLTIDKFSASHVILHPLYQNIDSGTKATGLEYNLANKAYDIAILKFEQQLGDRFASISAETPKIQSDVVYVGYGKNQNVNYQNDQPDRRSSISNNQQCGFNVIRNFENDQPKTNVSGTSFGTSGTSAGMIVMEGEGRRVGPKVGYETNPAPGDSGGPLLMNSEIIGVVSGVLGQKDLKHLRDVSWYSSMNDPRNSNFINFLRAYGFSVHYFNGKNFGVPIETTVDTTAASKILGSKIPAVFPGLETLFYKPGEGFVSSAAKFGQGYYVSGVLNDKIGLPIGSRILRMGFNSSSLSSVINLDQVYGLVQSQTADFPVEFQNPNDNGKTYLTMIKGDFNFLDDKIVAKNKFDNAASHCQPPAGAGMVDPYGFGVIQYTQLGSVDLSSGRMGVVALELNSPAARSALLIGDVITHVDRTRVETKQDLLDYLSSHSDQAQFIMSIEKRDPNKQYEKIYEQHSQPPKNNIVSRFGPADPVKILVPTADLDLNLTEVAIAINRSKDSE